MWRRREQPVGDRGSQEEPAGARRRHEEPGGTRRSQKTTFHFNSLGGILDLSWGGTLPPEIFFVFV